MDLNIPNIHAQKYKIAHSFLTAIVYKNMFYIQVRFHYRQLLDWRFHIRHYCRYVMRHTIHLDVVIVIIFDLEQRCLSVSLFPGQVGNVITNRNANRLEFERLLDGAKLYMRHHKVPSGMKKRVLRWYDYSWSRWILFVVYATNWITIIERLKFCIPVGV